MGIKFEYRIPRIYQKFCSSSVCISSIYDITIRLFQQKIQINFLRAKIYVILQSRKLSSDNLMRVPKLCYLTWQDIGTNAECWMPFSHFIKSL